MARMSAQEFFDLGLLAEINRRLLHPMGLAPEVLVDANGSISGFGGVQDYRADPEGIAYGDTTEMANRQGAAAVDEMLDARREARKALFNNGSGIEPSGWRPKEGK